MSLINSVNNSNKKVLSNEEKINMVINTFCKDLTKINTLDECGWTPLYRTIIAGDLFATKILIQKGADPNMQCSMGETPLYQAVDMCKLDHVKLLINSGANPNLVQDDGLSPLHAAVIRQNILIVKLLLKSGADPNIKTKIYNQSPVHIAIKNDVDPMILLVLIQFNGSLLERDKFEKRPIDYICSQEMQDAVEKLKFSINQNNDKKLALFQPLFQTPKKYENWEIAKVFSNTIRSKSSKKDLVFISKTLLKEPGTLNNNLIETNLKTKLNQKKNQDIANNNNLNNDNNNNNFGMNKENKDPNIRKERLSFNSNSQRDDSFCIESDKGDNENIIINDSYTIKNKNNQYQCNIDNFNVIYIDNLPKQVKSNNKDKLNSNNHFSKIPKIKPFHDKLNQNNKSIKTKKIINKSKNKVIDNEKKKTYNQPNNNNYLYIKPILSLNESNIKKNDKTDINSKDKGKNNEEDENEDIKRIFTFMENEGNKKLEEKTKNKIKEMDKRKSGTLTLSNTNTNINNNTSILNDELSINYLWKFKTLEDENMSHYKRNTESNITYSNNIDITNQNIKYPIYEWLKNIKLICYYNNFIERNIYNLDKLIYNLKNGICNIAKADIQKLGISIPGHVYRIITRMEIDSEKINPKISRLLLGFYKSDGNINILKNSVYYCCGCCSVQNQSKYYNNDSTKKFQLEQWLSKLHMSKYKNNFIKNGFDMFEYFILQMFSSIPVDENILKNDIKIINVKDRDFILLQINKDVKYIIKKSEKNLYTSINEINLEKMKQNNNNNDNNDNNNIKNMSDKKNEDINTEQSSNNCLIF